MNRRLEKMDENTATTAENLEKYLTETNSAANLEIKEVRRLATAALKNQEN